MNLPFLPWVRKKTPLERAYDRLLELDDSVIVVNVLTQQYELWECGQFTKVLGPTRDLINAV